MVKKIQSMWGVLILFSGLALSNPLIAQSVDPLTGRVNYSIPIGQVVNGSLAVPLSIAYSGGGVQVGQGHGTAGLGWNLVAGGRITRVLRGLPDDYNVSGDDRKGWLNSSCKTALSTFVPTADHGCADWATFSTFTDLCDTEPDIYEFNAPGLNGKFTFDNTGAIKLLPYQDLKITGTGGFVITTNTGIKYTFSDTEETYRKMGPNTTGGPLDQRYDQFATASTTGLYYVSGWALTSITGPAGEEINFGYSIIETKSRNFLKRVKSDLSGLNDYYYYDDRDELRRLTSISGPYNYATINWSENLVSSVTLTSGSAVHNFTLSFATVHNESEESVETGRSGSRSYLTSVTEDANCNAFPAYTFEYYSPELLPYKNNYPVDFFGYFNAASYSSEALMLIPSVYQNNSAPNGERFRIYSSSGYTTISGSTTRNVNASVGFYGSLKKVIYPSGGFAEISYEPNQYYDDVTADDAYGAGVRVSSLKVSDGDADTSNDIITNYEYKKPDGKSSGHWLYNPSFAYQSGSGTVISPDNLAPDQTILYERTSVLYPFNGKVVSEYLVPGVYPQTSSAGWNATRSRTMAQVSGTCPDTGTVPSGYYIFPYAQNTNFDFAQGLISKIQYYNQAGTLLREKTYAYQNIGPTAVTIKGMKLEKYSSDIWNYGLYTLTASTGKTIQTESVKEYDVIKTANSITTASNYTYNSNNLLSEVAVTNSDGKVSKVKYKYANDFTITGTPVEANALMIKKLIDTNKHGAVVETINLVDATVTSADLTLYSDFSTSYVLPKKSLHYTGNGSFTYAATSGSPSSFSYDGAYLLQQTVESVNGYGMPLSSLSLNKTVSGIIYGPDKVTPAVSINGARGSEVVFSDFENAENYQIAASNSVDAWSGEKSYLISTSTPIQKTSITKTSALNYVFRCRGKAAGAGSIKVELSNTSGWTTQTIDYGASGQWVLMNAVVPMTNVASSFTLKLTAETSDIIIDDLALYPDNSILQSATIVPFVGKTSETDNRGNASFYEYDSRYRLMAVRNTDRNLVQLHEYAYKSQTPQVLRAAYSCTGCESLFTGVPVTFTASNNNCITGLTYAWKVNGEAVGTNSTLNYAFPASREYDVCLTVTQPSIGSTSICYSYMASPTPFNAEVTGDNTELDCDDGQGNGTRTMSVAANGCGSGGTITYEWFFKRDIGAWQAIPSSNSNTLTKNCYYAGPVTDYVYFKCKLTSQCGDGVFNETVTTESNEFPIHKIQYNPPCPNP